MIDAIIEAMKAQVEKYKLELMQRYPNDLVVHDRSMLEWAAKPGVKLAWVLGDCHTHMVPLGLNRDEQELVECLTRLSSNDRFYQVEVLSSSFKLKELSREEFLNLQQTRVPYSMKGSHESCRIFCDGREVGHIKVTPTGTYERRVYQVKVAAVECVTEKDRAALKLWADKCATKMAGTLFCKAEFEYLPDYKAVVKAAA